MLVSDRHLCGARSIAVVTRQAAEAGVDLLQLREKDLPGRALLELARAAVAAATGTPLQVLVNSRADVAVLARAHGVHLPEEGLPADDVRRSFPGLTLSVSCHSLEAARRAQAAGADFVLLGPVFPTRGKENALGLQALAEAVAELQVPVHAIGGIEPANARDVWAAGAAGIAAVRSLLEGPMERAVRGLRA